VVPPVRMQPPLRHRLGPRDMCFEAKHHIDVLTANFVLRPDRSDVVVASNFFGGILSDLGPSLTRDVSGSATARARGGQVCMGQYRDSLQTNRPQHKGSRRDSRESPLQLMRRRGSAKASSISVNVLCAAISAVRSTRACAARRVWAEIAPAVSRSCPPPPPP
jgi:hypothetical protein